MQGITTKYLPATNTRGSRIKATAGAGQTITVSYDHSASCAHRVAAIALIKKLDWTGGLCWVEGGTETGMVYCAFTKQGGLPEMYNVFTVSKES